MTKRVLITGHNGYIGSVLAPYLINAGHQIVGLDTRYFGDCTLIDEPVSVPAIEKDIRDIESSDLKNFDAIIHLAALSNDPIGNLNERWTEEINSDATFALASKAKAAGVRRFLFSSSCIMYGATATSVVDESSKLDPRTEYARSKVNSELALQSLASDSFSPVYIRNGTVYGLSPRMRFDTVLNNLVGQATITKKVVIYSDGKPWRPVVHVEDLARSFEVYLNAPREDIHNEAFNNGADHLNYRIIDLAEIVTAVVPGVELKIEARQDADQRTYKTSFLKFARTFPTFEFRWTPQSGARELYSAFKSLGLAESQFEGDRFVRLKWLRHLLDSGRLDQHLRWSN